MKKTTLLKNLLKSPPISVKTFKSTQKCQFTPNDINQTYGNQQSLKVKIEKVNQSLNEEIKQRQFEFKELYKMVVDLQKSKKSKCKHSVVIEKKNQPQQLTHIPFTVLHDHNNQKCKKFQESTEINYNQKHCFTINDFSQLSLLKKENNEVSLMKKEKRRSKLGTIKSHKYLPTIYNSTQEIQMQNEEDNEEVEKSNVETTSSQFFSNSHANFNFNFDHREIVSPTKSIISNSNIRKQKALEDIEMKINYFENKLKSLEASNTFLKERVDTNTLKQSEFSHQLKAISLKVDSQGGSQNMLRDMIEENQKETNKIFLELSQQLKQTESINGLKSRIEKLQLSVQQINQFKSLQEKIKDEISNDFQLKFRENEGIQTNLINKMQALEQVQSQLFKQFGDLIIKQDQKLQSSKVKQSVSQNQSFAEPSFYTDKLSEIESRLENTEEIVSELMKVSLTLTQKINNLSYRGQQSSKKQKSQTKIIEKDFVNKSGLTESYWSLKEELGKIDEESIQSSREVINQSFLYNEDLTEGYQDINICHEQTTQVLAE